MTKPRAEKPADRYTVPKSDTTYWAAVAAEADKFGPPTPEALEFLRATKCPLPRIHPQPAADDGPSAA